MIYEMNASLSYLGFIMDSRQKYHTDSNREIWTQILSLYCESHSDELLYYTPPLSVAYKLMTDKSWPQKLIWLPAKKAANIL